MSGPGLQPGLPGEPGRDCDPEARGVLPGLSREEILRYSRHLVMPEVTLEGQKRLKASRVLCVGAGGLGSPLALYLAAAGVGTLGIVEFDTVDLTNIQRQILYGTGDVGRPKLETAIERLRGLNPEVRLVPHPVRLSRDNAMEIIGGYDVVADGTDNFATRYLVNDASVLAGKPNVYGSIFRFEGQVSVFDPPRGPCYRCLFPEPPPPGLVPSCAEGGVLGVLPGIIGSLQALEVLKLLLGRGTPLTGRLLLFDALALRFQELSVGRDPSCPVCGEKRTIHAPIDYEQFCGVRGEEAEVDLAGIPTVSVEELHRRRGRPGGADIAGGDSGISPMPAPVETPMAAPGETPTETTADEPAELIDVREPHEHAIARIPGSRLVPLSQLPARLHEFDSARRYVLHCHHGSRSLEAYRLLTAAGIARVEVLAGGVDAWAERIDPSVPRY